MKNLKQIREQFDLVTEKEENEERKLVNLVRSGLVDTNKLPLIKRALNKDNRVLTPSERNALMTLLDALMAQVLHSNSVYTKVKQNVMKEELRPVTTRMSDIPSILVLKRKSIRIYPGGQNVGLYYSQQLDRYVAVPFGGSKDMPTMMEEAQLDEVSDQLRNATYAKRVMAVRKSKPGSPEQTKNISKAAKTAIRTVAKDGVSAWSNMQDFADRYIDADKETQASYKKTYKKQKLAKKPVPPKKKAKPAPTPMPRSLPPEEKKKREKVKNKDAEVHADIMKGSIGKDVLSQHDKPYWMGHVVGRAIYRAKNKAAGNPPLTEEQLDELAPVVPLAMAAARAAGPYIARGAAAGARLAAPYVKRGVSSIASKFKGKAKTKRGAPTKQQRASKTRNRKDKDVDVDVANTNNNQSGGKAATPERKFSPTGTGSKLRVSTSSSIENNYRRMSARSMAQPNQPQRASYNEGIEVDLDGNKFLLNNIVAKKIQNVYESLNKTNKKKMIHMMKESDESLNKVISFVVRH